VSCGNWRLQQYETTNLQYIKVNGLIMTKHKIYKEIIYIVEHLWKHHSHSFVKFEMPSHMFLHPTLFPPLSVTTNCKLDSEFHKLVKFFINVFAHDYSTCIPCPGQPLSQQKNAVISQHFRAYPPLKADNECFVGTLLVLKVYTSIN
jgi:hypothetical protein